jgi:hypothetical protein
MRLRLFDRIRRLAHPRRSAAAPGHGAQGRHRRGPQRGTPPGPAEWPEPSGPQETLVGPAASAPDGRPGPAASFAHDRPAARPGLTGPPAVRVGSARARVREAPDEAAALGLGEAAQVPTARGRPAGWHDAQAAPDLARSAPVTDQRAPDQRAAAVARVAAGVPHQAAEGGPPLSRAGRAAMRMGLAFAAPHPQERPRTTDGRRNCGSLEAILWRQWDTAAQPPPAQVIEAIDRLAELPEQIKERLAAGLEAIFVGPGGVPELDEMTALRGVGLPSGQATWDACAGAYGDRKIVVGSRPSPTPDVMCHEIGHALDDLDSPPGSWQSDSAEFGMLYEQCHPHLASDFHRQHGGLGRKEFFADAFAAIASGQRPALVDMLSGDTRTALRVMLFFNRRYGI